MSFDKLKDEVLKANLDIVEAGLVVLTWGNASGVDFAKGAMAIKPSGVAYSELKAKDIVILSLATGEVIEGDLNPSSDTPTHLALYRAYPTIGGIVHTHSTYATSWAQSERDIPCLGTTHADHFSGSVPVARNITESELAAYEAETGKVIIETFQGRGLDPLDVPAVLLPHHGPFAWGRTPHEAVKNAIALEEVAKMALFSFLINPNVPAAPKALQDKHYKRKHGPGAYYGQESDRR